MHDARRLENAEQLFAATGAAIRHGGSKAYTHELTHWTKHPSRLNWLPSWARPSLCADLGITPEPRGDHASGDSEAPEERYRLAMARQ